MGNFDTLALDCLLSRERGDLIGGACDLGFQALLLGMRFLVLEPYLILQAITLLAQAIGLCIVDVLAAIGGLCVGHCQQRRAALDVLTFANINRDDRSVAR